MTSKDTDHSKRHLKADEKLDAAALREAELTERVNSGKITGGRSRHGRFRDVIPPLRHGDTLQNGNTAG